MTKRTNQPRLFTEMDKQEEYEQALFTAVCMACGYSMDKITKRARGRVNEAIPELVAVNATVEEVAIVVRGMLAEYKSEGTITPQGITGNWPKFVGGTVADRRKRKRDEMDECFERVKRMDRDKVEVAMATLKAQKPHVWGSWNYMDIEHGKGNDDVMRLCVRICQLVNAEAGR